MPSATDALVLALHQQLSESQWLSPEQVLAKQLSQAEVLLAHAAQVVPFYRDRLAVLKGIKRGTMNMEHWRRIPILKRSDIQEHRAALVAKKLPVGHGKTLEVRTSGSTGRPISVLTTLVTRTVFAALNLRYHVWHGRDFEKKSARITRGKTAKQVPPTASWVPGYPSGPPLSFNVMNPVPEQLDWLIKEQPGYLLTYPSNLTALLRHSEERGARVPGLLAVATMGEVLEPETRDLCRRVWDTPLADAYSSQELGMIALQCPDHDSYHVQSENILLEVLDDDDVPCPPGQVGRLVLTDLHNFALPLIRYDIGDYGVLGEACSCGRGLPVLRRVIGRTRNMVQLPSGDRLWPSIPSKVLTDIAPIRQFQLVQQKMDEIEVRLVVPEPLAEATEEKVRACLRDLLGYAFKLPITYLDEIPRAANGKYEDFRSEL
ncbi:phenylacetate--CoA ligase family protein [Magnetospira sp. QH-2]|uniref:phenylacetate--CoA ligase family protein n=1 Tax=Magnetospira sp. (strain QH-2) TaxID=1288970 RepID=UPI00130DF9E3|nr:phenylacetate--CoA ligase family protein [Magnetospira sp. QH-2]